MVFWLFLLATSPIQAQVTSHSPIGIGNLHSLSPPQAHTLIPAHVRPLLSPHDQESFLHELEGEAPDWSRLHDQPNEELGERLFAFNRKRDQARQGHVLLNQQIAFLWSGLLRQYVPEHQGFTIAMGPDFTKTDWGVVRFKPAGLPQEMIAIPSPDLHNFLQQQLAQGNKVEIKILFTGRLIPDESIIYAFSHDDPNQGMIMPVVQMEAIQYFLQSPE
ncbi:MAG: hypothetical protein JSU59_00910 [Nitrospirota bacterium]|nr:MAG: hypothetical protein JSU59_00910 [Nitrospirota bacterium]